MTRKRGLEIIVCLLVPLNGRPCLEIVLVIQRAKLTNATSNKIRERRKG